MCRIHDIRKAARGMTRVFNVTGSCNPKQHYMVDIEENLKQIKNLIDAGAYFTINRARQYGKTTTLKALKKYIKGEYVIVSVKELCITSEGKKYENPKTVRKYEKKLAKLQRQLAHKEKRSKNYYKTKKQIALCHEKITNTRKDHLHKISHEIVSENQVIVSENLQIKTW